MEPLAEQTEPDAPETEPVEPDSEDEEEEAGEAEEAAPADVPDAPEGLSPRELAAQQDKLDKERTRHANRVSEILGEAANDLLPCPICDPELGGFLYEATLTHPRDDVHARLLTVLTEPVGPEYKQDPQKRQCDVCDGWGELLTGSKRAQQEKVACSTCRGSGFYPPPGSPANGQVEQQGPQPVLAVVGDDRPTDDVDPWGHPRLLIDGQPNPNYGRMPQYIDPNYP